MLFLVCPISDGSDVRGVSIVHADVEEVHKIMDENLGIQSGIFAYEFMRVEVFLEIATQRNKT